MNDSHLLQRLLAPTLSSHVANALKRGATRREVLGILTAAGTHFALASGLAGVAMQAHGQTTPENIPRRGGRIRVATATASADDTLDPATASKAKSLADQIERVQSSGPNQVTITLAAPNADLPVILGTFHFHIVKDGTTDFSTGIGTGPYKLKEFIPGTRSIVTRNERYWKPGKPYLDEIELFGIGDGAARRDSVPFPWEGSWASRLPNTFG